MLQARVHGSRARGQSPRPGMTENFNSFTSSEPALQLFSMPRFSAAVLYSIMRT